MNSDIILWLFLVSVDLALDLYVLFGGKVEAWVEFIIVTFTSPLILILLLIARLLLRQRK